MAYVSPTITASGGTFAQLQAEGWKGHVDRLIGANSFTPATVQYLRALVSGGAHAPLTHQRISAIVDKWLSGRPVATAEVQQNVLDLTTAIKAYLAALEEIAVLMAANTGTLAPHVNSAGTHAPTSRTWP